MTYSVKAVEWAMRVQEVSLRAMSGHQPWLHVAEVSGLSPQTVRRWRYEQYGYDGLFDRRRRVPSARRVPLAAVQRLLQLYRDRYAGFNARQFYRRSWLRDPEAAARYRHSTKALRR